MEWIWLIYALLLIYLFEASVVLQSHAEGYNRSCSYQIPGDVPVRDEACLIYNLSGCPSNVWRNDGNYVGSSVPIGVNVTSYVHTRAGLSQTAVNFTFVIRDERVTGFAFRLLNGCENKVPICRYYDFYKVSKHLLLKTVFFNDDIYFPVSCTQSDCNVEVVALSPSQKSRGLKRLVFKIPARDTIENVANWRSLVVIDATSYMDEAVYISFTSAPKSLNVSSYVLQLYDKTTESTVSCGLVNGTDKVINVHFDNIVAGYEYVFKVAPFGGLCDCRSTVCNFAESPAFLPKECRTEMQPMMYILMAFVVILIIAIILIVVQRQLEQPTCLKECARTVYLVYSHDVEKHEMVVETLAAYLKNHCFCKVLLDKWDVKNKDPHVWVDDCIASSDYVLVIWSEGAFIKMSEKNSKVISCEPGYLGEDLFSLTMFKIKAAIGCELRKPSKLRNLHKFCHISFPYVPRHMVARDLPSLPVFCVPRDLNALLCHLHRIEPAVLCPFNKYPTFAQSNLSRTSDGISLLDTIDSVTREEYTDLFKDRLEEADQSVIDFSPRLSKNDANSETESASETDFDGGNFGIVDHNYPLNEFCAASDDLTSAYWLPPDATLDNEEVFLSYEPFVDITH